MTAEEFERSLTFYNRTLELEPHAVDAMLGKVRALTYLGPQPSRRSPPTDALIAERWFVGDARYWRALNESELELNEEAWVDIEAAAKLLVNAQVPKLAGLIAYRRQQLEVARAKFDESRTPQSERLRDRVLSRRRAGRAASVGTDRRRAHRGRHAASRATTKAYNEEIASIQASSDPPARKAARSRGASSTSPKGGGRSPRRGSTSRWRTTTSSRRSEARQFAEKVAADEQFGERARELCSRLRNCASSSRSDADAVPRSLQAAAAPPSPRLQPQSIGILRRCLRQ